MTKVMIPLKSDYIAITSISVGAFVTLICLGVSIYGCVDSYNIIHDGCIKFENCTYKQKSLFNGTLIKCYIEVPGYANTSLYYCLLQDSSCPDAHECWVNNNSHDTCPKLDCHNDYADIQRFFSFAGIFIFGIVEATLLIWLAITVQRERKMRRRKFYDIIASASTDSFHE